MSKKISFSLVILALFFSILACNAASNVSLQSETIHGSGTVVEESRTLSNFSRIEFDMQGTLHIEVGSSEALRIQAEDNLMEYIWTEQTPDKLVIRTKPGTNLDETQPIEFYLTVVKLDEIAINSSGDVLAPDLSAEDFRIDVSSSGDLTLGNLSCTALRVYLSSSGDASLAGLTADSINVVISSSGNLDIQGGQVQKQDITISSSGGYEAKELVSASADVTLSSSGSATIRVNDSLNGTLSSSGNVYYVGSPSVNVSTSSSGKAIQITD